MCSIVLTNFEIENLEWVNFFNQRRGPDKTTQVQHENFTFVHNLLSITGEFTPQPFINDNVICLYNGEIYNYKELKEDAKSDGEVIPFLYEKYGIKFVKHLDGEYAIIIADFNKNEIIIATDTFAIKPLWIGRKEGKFAAASYESVLERLDLPTRYKVEANSLHILDMDSLAVKKSFKIKEFDIDNQHKDTYDDWIKAFQKSIEKRSRDLREKIFIGLSGGYDSGAIACELKNQDIFFKSYSIKAEEDLDTILKRHEILTAADQEVEMIYLTKRQFSETQRDLKENAEEFLYRIKRNGTVTSGEYMTNDKGSVGIAHICSLAQNEKTKIYFSGQGADEIYADYGSGGRKIYDHSSFGGLYPQDLRTVYPWNSFYGSTQVSYLAKEENVSGRYGIEGRYPFLDVDLVQEFLWLTPELKNKYYKAPLHEYLVRNNFPFNADKKVGFSCDKNLRDDKHEDLKYLFAFLGQSRSGHSIIGAMINAHPNAVCANEYHLFKKFDENFYRDKEHLFEDTIENAEAWGSNIHAGGYNYDIQKIRGQKTFSPEKLHIIGNKKGAGTSQILRKDLGLIEKITNFTGLPLKMVRVVRNPFDMITTASLKDGTSLENTIKSRLENFTVNDQIEKFITNNNEIPADIMRIKQEDFIKDPRLVLSNICNFLNLPFTEEYLDNCSAMVFSTPQQSRFSLEDEWTPELRDRVSSGIEKYPYLREYTFDE